MAAANHRHEISIIRSPFELFPSISQAVAAVKTEPIIQNEHRTVTYFPLADTGMCSTHKANNDETTPPTPKIY